MPRANIPRADSAAAQWMRVFARGLADHPELYHVSPERAAEVAAAVNAFRSALAVACLRQSRSMADVRKKNDLRAAAERICRSIYAAIQKDARITSADKVLIGVRPPTAARSRRGAPQTRPLLLIVDSGTSHLIRWSDAATPNRVGKPDGCAMLQLFVALGPERVNRPEQARLLNVYTANRVKLVPQGMQDLAQLLSVSAGGGPTRPRYATYFARWASATGEPGPWSFPTAVRLAA